MHDAFSHAAWPIQCKGASTLLKHLCVTPLMLIALLACETATCPTIDDETPVVGPEGCPIPGLVDNECYEDSDCGSDEVCFDRDCRRDPACTDGDDSTRCPKDCEGICYNPNLAGYCLDDADCSQYGDGSERCRRDDRFCLTDRREPDGECVGWCVPACFTAFTYKVDPVTGKCFVFPDSCTPPGFSCFSGGDPQQSCTR